MRWIFLILTCGVLIGCSNADNQEATITDSLLAAARARLSDGGAAIISVPPVTRESALAQTPGPVLFVEVPALKAQASVVLQGQNQNVETWFSADGISLALRDGVLIGTRGFGADLMSLDLAGINRMLVSGDISPGRSYAKRYYYLNGEDQSISVEFHCQLQAQPGEVISALGRQFRARHYHENCQSADWAVQFENHYWLQAGRVVKSTQWIGPALGVLHVERLR